MDATLIIEGKHLQDSGLYRVHGQLCFCRGCQRGWGSSPLRSPHPPGSLRVAFLLSPEPLFWLLPPLSPFPTPARCARPPRALRTPAHQLRVGSLPPRRRYLPERGQHQAALGRRPTRLCQPPCPPWQAPAPPLCPRTARCIENLQDRKKADT